MIRPEMNRPIPSRAAVRPILRKIGLWSAQAAALFLLSRARMAGETPIFAPACFAAGVMSGWNAPAMLLGGAIGSLSGGRSALDLLPAISCGGAYALLLLFRAFRRFLPDVRGMDDFLCAMAAGVPLLIPALMLSGGIPYNLLTAVLGAAASALLAPALLSGLSVAPSRRLLMPEEQLSLSLFLMLLLIGLRAAPLIGETLSLAAAAFLTLVLSGAGAGMGALAGIAAGTALTLGGSGPFVGSTLGLCGLIAGCVRRAPRIASCLALLIGNLLTVTWGLGFTVGAMEIPPLLAAGAVYCLIPAGRLERLRGWIHPVCPQADAENMAVRLRRKAGRRLGELSEIFGELADGYGEKTALPGEQDLMASLRHALCGGCEGYADCWTGDTQRAGRLMCRMAAEALGGKGVTPVSELPPDLIRHCRRSGQIDRRVGPLLARLAQDRLDGLKRGEARGLMGRQFREAQRLLDSLATQMKSEVCMNREYAAMAAAALDRAGIRARNVTAVLDDRLEIVCSLKDGVWNAKSAQYVAGLLSDGLGIPFSPVLNRGRVPGECELRLQQAPALTASVGTACCAAEAGTVCGDSSIACVLPDGRLLAAISDGMGCGERAAQESARCISLLRKFVLAGIDRDAALTAVNSLLMLGGGEDMYATADLCVIDLYSGAAAFSKLGACRSFILGEKGLREIPGGRLPLGILDRVEPASARTEVHPGDLVVMISDGIADELKEGETEALRAFLPEIRRMKPEAAAGSVLRWAKERHEGKARDDMTVVAARILARRIRTGRENKDFGGRK